MVDPGSAFYEQCSLYENRSGKNPGNFQEPESDWRFQTWAKLVRQDMHGRLLDVGCGDGGFLSFARKGDLDVYGLDFDERAVDAAKRIRGLQNVKSGCWQDLERIEGWTDFDAITIFDVLEHLDSPTAVLKRLFSSLRPGGVLCVTVPRLDRWPKIFDMVTDFPPHHFTLWTDTALTCALTVAGFKDIRITKKPLVAEDLLYHIYLRVRRRLAQNNRKSESSSASVAVARRGRLRRAVKAVVLTSGNWFLRTFAIGRGYTLLALARRNPETIQTLPGIQPTYVK